MTPNHDQLYEVYELYLSNRKPGDPYWTFSGWLQHAGLSEKVPIRAHCMGVEFPPRLPANADLGPMQRKCLAGELVNPLVDPNDIPRMNARQVVSKLTGVPERFLVKLDDDPEWRTRK